MRDKIKKILMCICMGILFVSCNNETVILNKEESTNEVETASVENKEVKDEKKVSSVVMVKGSDMVNGIMEKVEEVHPNPYKNADKDRIIREGNLIFDNNKNTYLAMKKFLSLYGDISLNVDDEQLDRESIALKVIGDDRGLFIDEKSGKFEKGDKIIKIGNMDIKKIIQEGKTYYPMNSEGDILCDVYEVLLDKEFLNSLNLVKNEMVKVEVLRENISIVENIKFQNDFNQKFIKNSYEFSEDNKVAILKLVEFKGEKDLDAIELIQEFFDDVNLLKSDKVVVDLRGDKRIDTSVLKVIGKYIPVDEYRDYERVIKKSDAWENGGFHEDGFIKNFLKGDKVKIKRDKNQDYRFNGQIYVLMNGASASSQYKVASILKEDFNGKIIGNPSWRSKNVFGDNVWVELESGGMRISIPTTEFVLNGEEKLTVDIFNERFNCDEIDKEQLVRILATVK